jgi:hypothetical protein
MTSSTRRVTFDTITIGTKFEIYGLMLTKVEPGFDFGCSSFNAHTKNANPDNLRRTDVYSIEASASVFPNPGI